MKKLLLTSGMILAAGFASAGENNATILAGQGSNGMTGELSARFGEYKGFDMYAGMSYFYSEDTKEDAYLNFDIGRTLLRNNSAIGGLDISAFVGAEMTAARFNSDFGQSGVSTGARITYVTPLNLGIVVQGEYHQPLTGEDMNFEAKAGIVVGGY